MTFDGSSEPAGKTVRESIDVSRDFALYDKLCVGLEAVQSLALLGSISL